MAKKKPRGNPDKIRPFQWKPGESGNPKGRPRKEPLTDMLKQILAETIPKEQDPRQSPLAYVLLRNWVLDAIRTKDTPTIVAILDRIDGKVQNRLELGGKDGEPIQIQSVDPKRFTDEELELYEQLIRKGAASGSED